MDDGCVQDMNPTTRTYLYMNMSAENGVTVTILTIVIFIDEWHPVTQESTKEIQYRPLCTTFGERLQFGPMKARYSELSNGGGDTRRIPRPALPDRAPEEIPKQIAVSSGIFLAFKSR